MSPYGALVYLGLGRPVHYSAEAMESERRRCYALGAERERAKFARGDLVRKRSGSAWEGIVVGEYSTSLTREGYAVESLHHPGSVQIYPAAALELVARSKTPNA